MNSTTQRPAAPAATAVDSGPRKKYLTIFLGGEEYGVDVMKVQEIISVLPITRVPRTPDFMRGVINLRGRIIPVMELRARFGMPSAAEGRETCIVVVSAGTLLMGFMVDGVRDMLDVLPGEIEPVPDFGMDVDTEYLTGVARRDSRVVLLLDIERVLTTRQTDALSALRHDEHNLTQQLNEIEGQS